MEKNFNERYMEAKKRIALIAHDHKKYELVEWALHHKKILNNHELFATGTTGALVEEALSQPIQKFQSGPLGGDQQIGSLIVEGKIDILIFFWDPMAALPHDPDIKALLRIGAVWNIGIACDSTTADYIISSPFMNQPYNRSMPDYESYKNRNIEKGT
ncbi:MAG TPA: methylglyoxal synthase [Cytophagaceae bacterium]|jgi:methylglyoxal synthase|nr:methylglyoxal synthase [Cytophagaceae bacterium]